MVPCHALDALYRDYEAFENSLSDKMLTRKVCVCGEGGHTVRVRVCIVGGRGFISGNATVTATSPPPSPYTLLSLLPAPLSQLLEEWKPRFQAARQCYRDRKRKLELLSMAVLPMEPGEGGGWIYRSTLRSQAQAGVAQHGGVAHGAR